MNISEQEKQFAAFILAKSGKQQLLQPIIDRCEKDGITVWKHFEEGLIQQYGHTQPEAQRKVQEWYSEYLQQTEKPAVTPPVTAAVPPPVSPFVKEEPVAAPPPVNGKSRFWLWLIPVLLLASAAAYYYLYMMKPGKESATTLYVLAEDGLVLRTNTECDTAKNKKIINIAYNQPVELAEKIDSNRNWVKVRVPNAKGADGKTLEGYVAEYRMLGTKDLNASLDSIYRDRAWNPQAERLSYPLKKSLYQYIKNTNYEWFVDPVTDETSFQTVVDLSRKQYGKAVINNCALTSYTKYRVAILTSRLNGYKKAMIFSLSNNYTSEKIDELDLSGITDPIMYKAENNVYITEGRNKDAKKYMIDKNSSGAPVFKEYIPPPLFDPNALFDLNPYDVPDSGTQQEQ